MTAGLQQDMAKSFAGCTDGKTKYELYIEATGFDKMIIDLRRASADVESMAEDLEKLKMSVEACPSNRSLAANFATTSGSSWLLRQERQDGRA